MKAVLLFSVMCLFVSAASADGPANCSADGKVCTGVPNYKDAIEKATQALEKAKADKAEKEKCWAEKGIEACSNLPLPAVNQSSEDDQARQGEYERIEAYNKEVERQNKALIRRQRALIFLQAIGQFGQNMHDDAVHQMQSRPIQTNCTSYSYGSLPSTSTNCTSY